MSETGYNFDICKSTFCISVPSFVFAYIFFIKQYQVEKCGFAPFLPCFLLMGRTKTAYPYSDLLFCMLSGRSFYACNPKYKKEKDILNNIYQCCSWNACILQILGLPRREHKLCTEDPVSTLGNCTSAWNLILYIPGTDLCN